MKKPSQYFNKKSRLIQQPEINVEAQQTLKSFEPQQLKHRLNDLLTIQNDFFPCFDWVFPPPLLNKATAPTTAAALFDKQSVIRDRYSIYLHSPFCKTLCSFCYYAIIPGKGIDLQDEYIDHLIKEMELYSQQFEGQICESIYFGGGTPTYLDVGNLKRVFHQLHSLFQLSEHAEITIEAAPGTLSKEKLKVLKELGVTRLSYGIQTLDEKLLASMNREYTVQGAIKELTHALEIIGNVNVDTMYGFEGERDQTLLDTLSVFKELGVPSLSIYALDTQRDQVKEDLLPPKDNAYQEKIDRFALAEQQLKSWGYEAVLQNVFIQPDKSSYRHQIRRWDNLPLLAMGINAQGYAPHKPYQNVGSLKSYYQMIDEGILPIASIDTLDLELVICRELTSKLRFTYVCIQDFHFKYGVKIDEVFSDLIAVLSEMGYLSVNNNVIKMTKKASYYNNIIPMLFAPDSYKQQLLGLPEEYLSSFPVPFIMTQLGKAQNMDFNVGKELFEFLKSDRRVLSSKPTLATLSDTEPETSALFNRRAGDQISHWTTLN